jgi:sugar phosphate isomerase/epimerase
MIHDRISVNAVCFPGTTLRDLAGRWRELGVSRVNLESHLLLGKGLPAAREALRTGNCALQTITHVFLAEHLSVREESWRAARDALNHVINSAGILGARSIQLLTGGHGSLTWEEAADTFRRAIAPCVAHARTVGIDLMIENAPPLYADLHIAHTLRDAVTLAGIADVGICMDLIACWTEAGLQKSIECAMPRLQLVQVGDYVYGDRALPSRAVPGDGAIPVKRIIEWILAAGYDGIFDLELLGPRIDRDGHLAATRRAARYVGEILTSFAAKTAGSS